MVRYDKNSPPEDRQPPDVWAIVATVAVGLAVSALAFALSRRKEFDIITSAHASDGSPLPVSYVREALGSCCREEVCYVTVHNTAQRESPLQSGEAGEVSTSAPTCAKEVCLHISIADGELTSAPMREDGQIVPHVRHEHQLIVFVGDMQPFEELTLAVALRPDR